MGSVGERISRHTHISSSGAEVENSADEMQKNTVAPEKICLDSVGLSVCTVV